MTTYEQPLARGRARRAPVPATSVISLGESMRVALRALLANKLRTLLTALGVIIGVAAVVALLAIGRGAQQQIEQQITANGANLLTVRPGSLRAGGFSSGGSEIQSLTAEDARALADPANVPAAALVSPEQLSFATLAAGSTSMSAMVTGVTPSYLAIHNHQLAMGEFISDDQLQSGASVVVLGSRVAETLFPGQDPLGRQVKLNGQPFRVVGVLASKGGDVFGSADEGALVPLTTAQRKLSLSRAVISGKPSISAIVVQARDEGSIEAAQAQIAATLRERHRLPWGGEGDDFSINNQQDLIETLSASQRTMTLYLGAIAAISLLVGGIGIMNIMLVSVGERTREIGLRKALGARERDILTQFLIEALTLSTGGGLLGLLLGVLIALGARAYSETPASVSPLSALLAVGFAMAVGLFFGIEPARRAARLDPIEALRYE